MYKNNINGGDYKRVRVTGGAMSANDGGVVGTRGMSGRVRQQLNFDIGIGREDTVREVSSAVVQDIGVRYEQGVELYEKRQNAEAKRIFRELLTLGSEKWHGVLVNALGVILFTEGKAKEAEELFRQALDDDMDNAKFLCNLGYALLLQGEYESAQRIYERALKIEPDDVIGLTDYARILEKQGKDALEVYERLLKINPEDTNALSGKGMALYQAGKYVAAGNVFIKYLKVNPKDGSVHWNMGRVYCRLEKYELAEIAYHNALTCDPSDIDALRELGRVLLKLKKGKEAEIVFRDLNGEGHEYDLQLGIALGLQGKVSL